MSPRALDPDTIEARLRLMREAVEDLEALGDLDEAALVANRHTRCCGLVHDRARRLRARLT